MYDPNQLIATRPVYHDEYKAPRKKLSRLSYVFLVVLFFEFVRLLIAGAPAAYYIVSAGAVGMVYLPCLLLVVLYKLVFKRKPN